MYHVLTPAYGRDYRSRAEVLKDWNADLDFVLQPAGQLINRAQVKAGHAVNIRYQGNRKVAVIRRTEGDSDK